MKFKNRDMLLILVLHSLFNVAHSGTVPPVTVPADNNDCTFGVALNQTDVLNPFLGNKVYANKLNGLNFGNRCRMASDYSFNFVEVCAAVGSSKSVQLQTRGAFPSTVGFDWLSTLQNGLETGCRSGILRFTKGVSFSLNVSTGVVESPNQQAGWSSFSVTNSMLYYSDLFSAYAKESTTGYNTVQFVDLHINPSNGIYNSAEYQYTCKPEEIYFFSFSAGVPAKTSALLVLDGLDKTISAQRLSKNTNELTTISRTILARCVSAVKLVVYSGVIVPGNNTNLIHFMAFPYESKSHSPVSWAAYRTIDSDRNKLLSFDNWDIVQNILPVNNTYVKINANGYYYVYVSIGTYPNRQSSVSLRKNNEVVFNVERLSTNFDGVDIIGHGMVMYLVTDNVLHVEVEHDSIISSNTFGFHTSFMGMLINQ